jgi:hypothetical protein
MPSLSDSQYLLPELVVGRLNVSVILSGDAFRRSLEDAWCEYARRSLQVPVLPSQVAAVVHPLRVVAAETARAAASSRAAAGVLTRNDDGDRSLATT